MAKFGKERWTYVPDGPPVEDDIGLRVDFVVRRWPNYWQQMYAEAGRNPAPWPYEPKTPRYRPDDGLKPSHTFIPSYAWAQSPWRRDRVARPGGKKVRP